MHRLHARRRGNILALVRRRSRGVAIPRPPGLLVFVVLQLLEGMLQDRVHLSVARLQDHHGPYGYDRDHTDPRGLLHAQERTFGADHRTHCARAEEEHPLVVASDGLALGAIGGSSMGGLVGGGTRGRRPAVAHLGAHGGAATIASGCFSR